ncbi:MAG: zinc ribbon domain-containing protein [Candidatus Zipacnadales bacterium]
MADELRFVRNYKDLSTERGFQFEFFCDRCGSGFRTRFQASVSGTASEILDTAGDLLGGIFSRVGEIGERVHSVAWERGHDAAFERAVEEIKPDFAQCPRCSSWVCRESCWNTKRGLCKECAPDLGVEMSAAQASRSVEEIWAHAAMAEEDKHLAKENWRQTIRATCPECEEPLATNAKFCPNCGAALKPELRCKECGAKLEPKAKFCPECGAKQ